MPKKKQVIDVAYATTLYNQGMSIRKVADKMGITKSLLFKKFKEHSVPLRDKSNASTNRYKNVLTTVHNKNV